MDIICSDNEIIIRLLENDDNDFHLLHNWLSSKFVYDYYGDSGEKDFKFVMEKYMGKLESGNQYPCIIEYDNKPIGYIQFFIVDKEEYDLSEEQYSNLGCDGKKVFGIDMFIGEDGYRDRGLGTKVLKIMVDAIFSKYEADTILIDPKTINLRAIACYRKAGFKDQFIAYQREEKDGVKYDNLIMKIDK